MCIQSCSFIKPSLIANPSKLLADFRLYTIFTFGYSRIYNLHNLNNMRIHLILKSRLVIIVVTFR